MTLCITAPGAGTGLRSGNICMGSWFWILILREFWLFSLGGFVFLAPEDYHRGIISWFMCSLENSVFSSNLKENCDNFCIFIIDTYLLLLIFMFNNLCHSPVLFHFRQYLWWNLNEIRPKFCVFLPCYLISTLPFPPWSLRIVITASCKKRDSA